jgi:hypothetical protein
MGMSSIMMEACGGIFTGLSILWFCHHSTVGFPRLFLEMNPLRCMT